MTDLSRRNLLRSTGIPGPDPSEQDLSTRTATARPTLRHPGTSLTPYGMSFWALILAACGGGSRLKKTASETVSQEGHVYDGPVKGADVYVDSDGNGELNKEVDHLVGTTNEQGAFSGSVPRQHAGKRYIVDLSSATDLGDDGKEGTSDDQDLSGFGIWLAPEGASVVSALTHLIAAGVMTREEVQSAIPGFDPLVDNPYTPAPAGQSTEKQQVFETIRKVLPTITNLVQKHRDVIDQNAPQLSEEQREAQRKVLDDLKAEVTNNIKNPDAPHAPVLARLGTSSLKEGTLASDTDTGLRFRVTDVNGNFTGPPTVSDSRFELREAASGEDWELWAKKGNTFTLGGDVSLTVTATDNTNLTDTETISFTIGDIEHPPAFTSGATGTGLTEIAAVSGAQVYDANAAVGAGSSGSVRYELVNAPDYLAIDSGTGVVTLTRDIDLDAAGEPSRVVRFTVRAVDSADASRATDKEVSFTITNSDEKPESMTVTPVASSASFSEDADKSGGLELAQVTFDERDNPTPADQNNTFTVTAVSGSGHSLGTGDFEVRGTSIYLKQTANTSVSADTTVTVTVTPVTSGHGTQPSPQNFTFIITNENQKPIVDRHGTKTKVLPLKTESGERFDTGVVFILSDPDNIGLREGDSSLQDVEMLPLIVVEVDGVIVSGDFFELVQDTEYVPVAPYTMGQRKYTLMVKGGKDLTAFIGKNVSVTVKGKEVDGLESEPVTVTLKGLSSTTPHAIGDGEIGVDGLTLDGDMRYFVIGPGKSVTAVVGGETLESTPTYRWSYKRDESIENWQPLDETTKTLTPLNEGLYRLTVAGKSVFFAAYRYGNQPVVSSGDVTDANQKHFENKDFHFVQTEGKQPGFTIHDALARILPSSGTARITNKDNAGESLPGVKTDVTITQMWSDGVNAFVQFTTAAGRAETAMLGLDGADADKFVLVVVDGNLRLMFGTLPDYEEPHDSGENNVYDVSLMNLTTARDVKLHLSIENDYAEDPPVYGTKTDNTMKEDEIAVTKILTTDVDAAYQVTEGETTVQSLTAESLATLFGITLPAGGSVQLNVLSDRKLLLEHSAAGEASKEYVITMENYSSWGHESLFRFIDRGVTDSGSKLVDIQFLSAPNYENPIGQNAVLNSAFFNLKLAPVSGSVPAEIVKRVGVTVKNDRSDTDSPKFANDSGAIIFSIQENKVKAVPFTSLLHLTLDPEMKLQSYQSRPDGGITIIVSNESAGESFSYVLRFTGPDADHLQFKMGHDDIYVLFKEAPDYEKPNDADKDYVYEVTYIQNDVSIRAYKFKIIDDPSDNVPLSSGQAGGQSVVPLSTAGSDGFLPGPEEELSLPMADIA